MLLRGAGLTIGIVLAAAAVASAGGGSADVKRGICANTLCVFTDTDFAGQEVDVTKLGLSNRLDNKIPGQAESLVNDRDGAAFFYAKRDGKGRTMCINSGDSIDDLAQVQLVGASSTRLIKRRSCFHR
jgi:hypothetical protein